MIQGVPYDVEIEYLESTGTQWIDTGVVPNGLKTTIDFRLLTNAKKGQIAGCHNQNNQRYYPLEISGNTISFRRVNRFDGVVAEYGKVDTERHITVYYFDNKAFFDGIETQSNDFAIQSASYSCILFSITINGVFSADNAIPMRMYSCRMENDTTLVRDFIPVRVGQTGYLYDRVSKRLFGNKGTGSFVLGPDVAKPVMGLWEMRKFYNARDYVQDGLVGMWDGIENAGWGTHSVITQQWVDLTGNEQPIVPSYTGTGQGFSWTGTYLYNFIYEARQNSGVARDYSLNGMTVEWVMRDLMKWRDAFLVPSGFQANNYYVYKAFGTSGNAVSKSNVYNLVQAARSLSICVPPAGVGIAYLDGGTTNMATNNSAKLLPLSGTGRIIFGSGSGNTHNAPVYAIRIYNRALSTAEIAHNYAIDKARFNLP